MGKCCSWPHGPMSIGAMILSIIALAFNVSAVAGCFYFQTKDISLTPLNPPLFINTGSGVSGIGLFTYEWPESDWVYGSYYCYYYSESMRSILFDSAFNAAYVFGILSLGCMAWAVGLLNVIACVAFSPMALKGIGALCMGGSLFALLTLTAFASNFINEYNATFSWGAGFAIVSSIFSLVVGVVVCMLPPARQEEVQEAAGVGVPAPQAFQPGTVTVTETTLPDGTVQKTKTTVNADGSQTVEETILQAQANIQAQTGI
jgi:hypothetical protein